MNESLSLRNQFWATVVKELRDQLAVKDARIKELEVICEAAIAAAKSITVAEGFVEVGSSEALRLLEVCQNVKLEDN